ncbi:hypothetical protein F5883DRAFT_562460 [Diaporthe sp. PMI_573]|nr:hypothetical protein F5883DRAFT_562460 [Diaporthaceae sp. PMI_573]
MAHFQITREVIESFFSKAVLGYYKIYGQTQHHHCVLNRTTPEMRILEVQLWSSHSEWIFDTGSHQHDLKATAARNGLLKILPQQLQELRVTPTPVEMPVGGLALADARLGFKTLKGKVAKRGR